MDLSNTLQSLGFSENQSRIYLAALQLGEDSVLHIAKHADVKRPTAYLLLDDLQRMGLVSQVKRGKKTLYRAESPDRILTDVKQKEALIADALPSLKAIHNLDPEKPSIKIAEGVHGVRSVYNSIFTYLAHHPNEELLIFGSLKDAAELFEQQVVNYFYTIMKQSKNRIREIGNDDHQTRKYFRGSHSHNPNHDIRLIRSEGTFTQTDNMIYGNTLVIFSVKEQIFATTIESANIAATYRTLFEMAWRSGKPI